ncbi:glycosyltransferase family 4 protein [Pontibacter burrus]|uniref:Glycosyltransferase family 4 protein n=1 Tax=Pontibacter burrus TaxID=2704466 RepID=A0A6B3LYQ5_9BACT|nr:glycosyltransferase family 4 protein [Pontibacter burrus]NEM98888.1 glycosyltransferase family 4 protein [Pontibacter burrus]
MLRTIYTDALGYNQVRNFVSIPHRDYVVKKRLNIFRLPNALYFKYYNASNSFFLNSHYEPFKTKDIHHFFNTISFGNTPWVTTFETLLPRWGRVPDWLERKGIELLAGGNCKKLIAVSECTKNIQSNYLNKFPKYKETILGKTMVLHPPQELLINSYEDKLLNDDYITFTIIGADFFRKGGKEILAVFDKLLSKGSPIKLNIVSSLQYGDYASGTTKSDKENALQIIEKHPRYISLFSKLSNDQVLELLKKTHIGLLPTYADTYGYSVLEAQAAACPVITTNIRALPEINNDKCGWVINVPIDTLGNGKLTSETDRKVFSNIIEEELYNIIDSICNDPALIRIKGEHALRHITADHNPSKNADALNRLYREI